MADEFHKYVDKIQSFVGSLPQDLLYGSILILIGVVLIIISVFMS